MDDTAKLMRDPPFMCSVNGRSLENCGAVHCQRGFARYTLSCARSARRHRRSTDMNAGGRAPGTANTEETLLLKESRGTAAAGCGPGDRCSGWGSGVAHRALALVQDADPDLTAAPPPPPPLPGAGLNGSCCFHMGPRSKRNPRARTHTCVGGAREVRSPCSSARTCAWGY